MVILKVCNKWKGWPKLSRTLNRHCYFFLILRWVAGNPSWKEEFCSAPLDRIAKEVCILVVNVTDTKLFLNRQTFCFVCQWLIV